MKSFSQYLAEAESTQDPQSGDSVDVIINEEMVVETAIAEVTEDAVILEADAEAMRIMELAGMLSEQPAPASPGIPVKQASGGTATPLPPQTQTPTPAAAPDQSSAETKRLAAQNAAAAPAPAASGAKPGSWREIYNLNKDVVGSNPNLIYPGQQLKMPDGSTYTVKPGDSLSKIARGTTGAAPAKPAEPAKAEPAAAEPAAAEPAAEPPGEPGGAGLRTSAGRDLKTINRDIEQGKANIAQRQQQQQQAAADADAVAAQQNRELDQLDQLKKNAGVRKPAAPAASANPWQGKDAEKAAAWSKLSPADQKWIGNADPTDPYILARAPSQPSAASQMASGVRDIGRNIRGAFGFGPKAQQAAPAAAPAPAPSTATPGFGRQPINIEESSEFVRMLELAGLNTDQKKKLTENPLKLLAPLKGAIAPLFKKGRAPEPPRVEPTIPRQPAPATQPHPTLKGPDGKPLQVPVQPSAAPAPQAGAAPAAQAGADAAPQGIDPMVWARMPKAQQDRYLDNAAKAAQRAMQPPPDPFVAGVKQTVGKATGWATVLGTAYGVYQTWDSYSTSQQSQVKDEIARQTRSLLQDGVPEDEVRSWLSNQLKIPAGEVSDIIQQAGSSRTGAPGAAAPAPKDPYAGLSANKRAELGLPPAPGSEPAAVKEAEYQGRDVELGKPMSNTGGGSKYKVYVRDPQTGNIRKVTFGDPNMTIKRDDPERRKNFRARHGCGTARASDRTKAAYWSCRMWSSKPVSKILKGK